MSTQTKFKDDDIRHIESDIKKIQLKPGMYISYVGARGALHLCKEIINNAIDECTNVNSPGNEIDIHLDEAENTLTVTDNGRGFPFDRMEIACTYLQSGSKFYREEGGGGSAGENGVGLTACNAMSDRFEIVSNRYSEKASIVFNGGELVEPLKTKKTNNDKHGTTFRITPSPLYLRGECPIVPEDLMDWIEDIVSLVPHRITINLSIVRKGKEGTVNKKYRNKDGLISVVNKLSKKLDLGPIHFMKSMTTKEIVPDLSEVESKSSTPKMREIDRFIGLEVAFAFNSEHSKEVVARSFCNFVTTNDHGVHLDGVKTGIAHYLTRQARETLSEKETKAGADILQADVTTGLTLSVFLSTDLNPQLIGQTKEKVGNQALFSPLRSMTVNALTEHFRNNPKELKKAIDYIRANMKARLNETKARNSVLKGETNNLSEHGIPFFTPANNKGKNDYRELLIIEGESAAGSAEEACFNDFQATFGLKGVPLNTFKLELARVLTNDEFRNLVKVLRCNIGDKFNIDDLWYDKVITMTDSDADGKRIFSLLCVFFLVFMPAVIERGRLFKAVAPLYKIDDKKRPFILNKKEYIEVFEERIGDNIRLINPQTKVVMKSKDLQELLMRNRTYLEELHRVSTHFSVHPDIIEYIAIHGGDQKFVTNFNKRFPEITLDSEGVLSGVYQGRFQILNYMDKIFLKKLKIVRDIVLTNPEMYFGVHEKSGKDYTDLGIMTIGALLAQCQKFQPKIETRFKGLGELQSVDLREKTLDPNNRILIQLTMADAKEELEKFRILHGDDSDERKKLMEHFRIDREDLDN